MNILNNILYVFGFAKITRRLLSIVNHGANVIVFTRENFDTTEKRTYWLKDAQGIFDSVDYVVVADNEPLFDISHCFDNDTHILLVNCYAYAYLLSEKDMHIVSVARTGLLTTYCGILLKEGGAGQIICFDNDKSIANEASSTLSGSGITVSSGVAHLLVPSVGDNIVTAAKKGYLVFPPLAEAFKAFFASNEDSNVHITFCITETAYANAVTSKLVDINLVHTVASLFVLEKHMENYNTFRFSDLSDSEKNEMVRFTLFCHSFLYDHWTHGFQFKAMGVSVTCAEEFLKNLFGFNELVSRGIDPSSNLSMNKLQHHLKYFTGIPEIESTLYLKCRLVFDKAAALRTQPTRHFSANDNTLPKKR